MRKRTRIVLLAAGLAIVAAVGLKLAQRPLGEALYQRAAAARVGRDVIGAHSTPEVAADSARVAGVKQLVFSHLVPVLPSRFFYPAFLGDAKAHFAGPITVGEDGMLFSLPAGTTEIHHSRLF